MKLLVDTHILIWLLNGDPALKPKMRSMLADRSHDLTISIASIWEISIKKALGRLHAPDDIIALLELNRMRLLPITADHAFAVRSLPPLHGDPFDRILVVQALLEDLTIVTRDRNIQRYAVPFLKA